MYHRSRLCYLTINKDGIKVGGITREYIDGNSGLAQSSKIERAQLEP